MKPGQEPIGRRAVQFALRLLIVSHMGSAPSGLAADATSAGDEGVIPQPMQAEDLKTVLANSPFVRSLGVSDSIILTGVARIDDEVVATLLDTDTMESHVVTGSANSQGWQLVGIGGNEANPKSLSAKIQIAGGQVVSIRYKEPPVRAGGGVRSNGGGRPGGGSGGLSAAQLDEAKKAAINYREGFSGDGYRGKPPAEIVEKLSRFSAGQREEMARRMMELRNQGVGGEDRRRAYNEMLDRPSQVRR